MKVRYKNYPEDEREVCDFNPCSLCEVNMGDDSASVHDLEVLIGDTWKNLALAFDDRDVVPNNLNTSFGVPINNEALVRGYNP